MPTRWTLLAVAVVALIGGLRARSVEGVEHDGAISFIAATAHLRAWESAAPVGRWVPARTWQAFWTLEPATAARPATFRRIATDLGRLDIHPPLYFWALHVWMAAGGTTPAAAAWLNVLWLVVAVALVDRLARAEGAHPRTSAAVAALWGVSGASLSAVVEPRPYVLVALLSAAFLLALRRAARQATVAHLVGLALVAAAGLLTHYHMALVGVAGGLVMAWRHRTQWRLVARLAAAGVAALGLAVAVHPWLGTAMARRGRGEAVVLATVERMGLAAAAVPRMLLPSGLLPDVPLRSTLVVLAVVGVGLALVVAGVLWRRRTPPLPDAVLVGGLALAGVVVLFVAGSSPPHAMGPKYTMLVAPLLAAGLAAAAGSLRWRPERVLTAGVVLYALAGGLAARHPAHPPPALPPGVPLVVDSVHRGVLPPVVWGTAPETLVLAGPPDAVAEALRRRRPERFIGVDAPPLERRAPRWMGESGSRLPHRVTGGSVRAWRSGVARGALERR